MKWSFIVLLIAICLSCKEPAKKNTEPKPVPVKEKEGKYYFDFDELIHYKIDIPEWNVMDIKKGSKKLSEIDSVKYYTLTNDNFPKNIVDTLFINNLQETGFIKVIVDAKKFATINEIFSEKKHEETVSAACIPVYRDILIFKKQYAIVGIAKICFDCMQHVILGTKYNTAEFGQSGDYEKLNNLLYN